MTSKTSKKQVQDKTHEKVGGTASFNRLIDGAAKKLEETVGPKTIQHIYDGAAKRTTAKVGKIVHSQDGNLAKAKSFYGKTVKKYVDAAIGGIDQFGNGVQIKALRALNAVQQEAAFVQAKSDSAKNTVMGSLNVVESGIIKATTTPLGHQVGTSFAGMKFGAQTSLMFNPATCFDTAKALKDILAIIAFLKKLTKKLKKIGLPGFIVNALLRDLNKLGKFGMKCVDVSAAASAQIASKELAVSALLPTAPTDPDPVNWTLEPVEPPVP